MHCGGLISPPNLILSLSSLLPSHPINPQDGPFPGMLKSPHGKVSSIEHHKTSTPSPFLHFYHIPFLASLSKTALLLLFVFPLTCALPRNRKESLWRALGTFLKDIWMVHIRLLTLYCLQRWRHRRSSFVSLLYTYMTLSESVDLSEIQALLWIKPTSHHCNKGWMK